jgi:dTDP-4-dehydrorhamnose reductase
MYKEEKIQTVINGKVLITGCGGMLGGAIYPYCVLRYSEVLATDKEVTEDWLEPFDVRDEACLQKIMKEFKPDIVLHLAAETNLEYCETNEDIATDTNELATKAIAKVSEEYGAILVYISTAGVFDGTKADAYTEDDKPNPIMVYGKTKYIGERHALEYCSRSFVIRAGWMMGGGRRKEKKFIYKILRQMNKGAKEIFAVGDRWGTPTYTYDFAFNLFRLIETKRYGTYHMVCEGKGTRFDVAREIIDICQREDIKLTAVDSDYFKNIYFAPRPVSEMMVNKKLRQINMNFMRDWKESLKEYITSYFPDYMSTNDKMLCEIQQKLRNRACPDITSLKRGGYTECNIGRRKSPRVDYITRAQCKKLFQDPKLNDRSFEAVIDNLSKFGFCIYTMFPLEVGDILDINSALFPEKNRVAEIKWQKEGDFGIRTAGLIFMD